MKTSRIGVLLSVGVVFACAQATWGQAAGSQVTIGNAVGQIESLVIEAKALKLTGKGGGFFAYDATAKKDISFPDGTIKQSEGKTVFTCEKSGDLALAAEFSPKGPYVLVTGTLENRRRDERGIVLNYRLPISGPEAVFCNQLNGVVKVEDAEQEGNVFPIAAVVAGDTGLAMAIPPTSPLIFGMAADRTGLTTRFYLGLSPETKRFPNRASFAFIIYPVDPAWGFRSALRKYYSFFPEYYEVRTKRYGYLLFNVFGREEQDMDTYALDRIGLGGHAAEDFVRDAKHGLATTFALNVGCKELTRLPKTPKSREEAVEIYKSLCGSVAEEWVQGGPEPTACEIIDSSACGLSTGRPVVSPRFTGWGGSSISFTTNPDPDLFEGKRRNMGEVTLANIEGKFKDHPRLNGILIDSLGANWPATLNYRKDHFPYADYPLTFDPEGRVALHNTTSHYEFLAILREKLRARGALLSGNGIYPYPSRWTIEPEHYRGRNVMLGRFFLASLLDTASSEAGARSDQNRYEFVRAAMGNKLYILTNSEWTDPAATANWFNKCLVYGLFGQNVRHFKHEGGTIPYHPDGYARDREVILWFVRNARLLCNAGWQPETYAKASGEKILLERYGAGDTVYFALMSEHNAEQNCVLTVDLESLGFKAGHIPRDVVVEEIAQSLPVTAQPPNAISVQLKPFKTCILAVRKKA